MKKIALFSLIILLLPAYSLGGTITVTKPVAGQQYCMFKPQTIRWNRSGTMANSVRIYLMHPNGQSVKRTITMNAPNNGHYNWDGGASSTGNYFIKVSVAPTAQYPDQASGQSGVFTLANCDKPDLQVGAIKVTPQNPGAGGMVTFKANVMNYGNATAQNPVAVVRVKRPGGLPDKIFRQELNVSLQKNQGVTFVQKFKVPKAGNYTCQFSVDPADMIAETDNHNNQKNWTFGVHGLPDLIVCIDNGKRPPVGRSRDIRAMVKNIGSGNVSGMGQTKLRFFVKKKGTKTYNIPPLAVGASHRINRKHSWAGSGTKKISAQVIYNRPEVHTSNNKVEGSYFVRLPHHDKYSAAPKVKCSTGENFNSWQEVEQRY
jgi:hypothetical protein